MTTKRKGFMGALESAGFVESDEAAETSAPDMPPLPPVTAQAPVYVGRPDSMLAPPQPVLDADDQARLKAIEAQVYAAPSTYRTFQNVRASLNNSSDLRMVFNVLAAANPGVTPQKVLGDIDSHLGVISAKGAEFDSQVAQTRAARIDGPTAEIANLTSQNQAAAQQIAERTARIAQLQQSTQEAEKAIADGAARFKLIEDQLSAPLLEAKRLLSSLTQG